MVFGVLEDEEKEKTRRETYGEESSCATRSFYPMMPLCLIEKFLLSHLSLSFSVYERQEFVLFVR